MGMLADSASTARLFLGGGREEPRRQGADMENLFAWVPLLMAAELFSFAVTEAKNKHWVALIWFLVPSLLAFALAVYLNSPEGLNRLRFIIGTPPIAWFIIVTAVVARILCFAEKLRTGKTEEKRTNRSITMQTSGLAVLLWVALYLTNQALHPAQSSAATAAVAPSDKTFSVFFDPSYKGKQPPKSVWQNEPVPLDGYNYENCKLTNVTITYNGDTPTKFSHCSINSFTFVTSNPAIYSALLFLNAAGFIKPPGSPLGEQPTPVPSSNGETGKMVDITNPHASLNHLTMENNVDLGTSKGLLGFNGESITNSNISNNLYAPGVPADVLFAILGAANPLGPPRPVSDLTKMQQKAAKTPKAK